MEIKTLTIADLKKALVSVDFWRTETLPITRHRALSYVRNPRADENDPVLLVAYHDKRVIGYLGILPDKCFVDDATYKMGWLTSWWVDPSCSAMGVGAILLFKALNAYDQYIGVSGSSREARQALDASQKFMDLKPLRGLFKIFDVMVNEVVNLRSVYWQRYNNPSRRLTFEYISDIDEETDHFMQRHSRHDLMRKEKTDLTWIMNNPWILSGPLKDRTSKRYYFSSRAGRFSYLGVKVFEDENEMIGFILHKVRDDRMSVLYSYFERQNAGKIAAAACHHALEMEVSILSFYDDLLSASFSELRFPCWSAKKNSRGFSLSKAFADIPLTNFRLQGGDGDLAFY